MIISTCVLLGENSLKVSVLALLRLTRSCLCVGAAASGLLVSASLSDSILSIRAAVMLKANHCAPEQNSLPASTSCRRSEFFHVTINTTPAVTLARQRYPSMHRRAALGGTEWGFLWFPLFGATFLKWKWALKVWKFIYPGFHSRINESQGLVWAGRTQQTWFTEQILPNRQNKCNQAFSILSKQMSYNEQVRTHVPVYQSHARDLRGHVVPRGWKTEDGSLF